MIRKDCQYCGVDDHISIIDIDKIPLSVQSFHSSIKDVKKQSLKSLNIALCKNCLLISNIAYDNNNQDNLYNDNYYYAPSEISKKEKEFQQKLAVKINNHINLKGKTILEIGCGDGYFLNQLTKFGNNGIGYDPSAACNKAMQYKNLDVKKEIFQPHKSIHNNVDIFVLRHVLEHLEYPVEYLKSLFNLCNLKNEKKYLYIEVPNIKFCVKNNMYFDFYYDHIFYFNKYTLTEILNHTGWLPLHDVFGENNEFLGFISVNQKQIDNKELIFPFDQQMVDLVMGFKNDYILWEEKLLTILKNIVKDKKTFAIWGTGARGVAFLSNLDLDKFKPNYFIDSDPNKIGLFPPVGQTKIVDPNQIYVEVVDYILITSYTFFDEIAISIKKYKDDGGKLIKVYPTPMVV